VKSWSLPARLTIRQSPCRRSGFIGTHELRGKTQLTVCRHQANCPSGGDKIAIRCPATRVLSELHATLKADGVLFTSNPRGNNEEGWNRGRYGAYHDLESWRAFLERAAFAELEHYYRPPGLPFERQPWLASVWRKTGMSGEA
jgi:hypothetical protein